MENSNNKYNFCPICGQKREKDDNFCSNCGYSFIKSKNEINVSLEDNSINSSNIINKANIINRYAFKLKKYYNKIKFIPISLISFFSLVLFISIFIPVGTIFINTDIIDANMFQTFSSPKIGVLSIITFVFICVSLVFNVFLWIIFFKDKIYRKQIRIGKTNFVLHDILYSIYGLLTLIVFIMNCITISLFEANNFDSGLFAVGASPIISVIFYLLCLLLCPFLSILNTTIEYLVVGKLEIKRDSVIQKEVIENKNALGNVTLPLNLKEMRLVSCNKKIILVFSLFGIISFIMLILATIVMFSNSYSLHIRREYLLIFLSAPMFLMMFSHLYFIKIKLSSIIYSVLSFVFASLAIILIVLYINDYTIFYLLGYRLIIYFDVGFIILFSLIAIISFIKYLILFEKYTNASLSYNIILKEIKLIYNKKEYKMIVKKFHKLTFKKNVKTFNENLKKYHEKYCNLKEKENLRS